RRLKVKVAVVEAREPWRESQGIPQRNPHKSPDGSRGSPREAQGSSRELKGNSRGTQGNSREAQGIRAKRISKRRSHIRGAGTGVTGQSRHWAVAVESPKAASRRGNRAVWTLPGERDIGFRKRTHRDERNIAMAGATLRPKHERRVAAGHLWIYQGNIERIEGDPAPGDVIDVFSARGEFLGRGYYNPHSQIAIRLLT